MEKVQAALAPYVTSGAVPCVAGIIRQRGEVQALALGTHSLTADESVQRDSIFRISSMTKPITAAAALILVDRGVITLDEPIDRLLPELADRRVLRDLNSPLDDTVAAERPVTVRDLFSFTDGFGQLYQSPADYPILRAALDMGLRMGPPAPASQPAADEWLERLASLPLMQQPGRSWLYDTAADVLGTLIERASGSDFATFLQENLFEPLDMPDTSFSVSADNIHRFVTAYTPEPETGRLMMSDDPGSGQWSRKPAFSSGAGGLVSTCDDYLAFATMILNRGRAGTQQVLSPESVRLMTEGSLNSAQRSRSGPIPLDMARHTWGMGVSVVTSGDQLWPPGSYGWTGGLGTSWTTSPQDGVIAIVMTQVAMTTPASTQLFDDFSSAVVTHRPVPAAQARGEPLGRPAGATRA